MAEQTTLMALLRGLHLAATLSLLGATGFLAWMLPAAGKGANEMRAPLVMLWRVSGVAALLIGGAWFVLQSATIAGATDFDDVTEALPVVALHTRYGELMLTRGILLLAATLLAGRSRLGVYLALVLTAAALGLQGLIGHAGAAGGGAGAGLVASESLHLVTAGVWLGALLPLWLSAGRLAAPAATAVCERFSPIGLACVLVIAGTGLAQAVALIGGTAALFGTRYGHLALLKMALFLITLILAVVNRLWLTDRLNRTDTARVRLRQSIAVETAAGLAIVVAAGFLASSVPAEHETPVWPFPWRFSLVTVNEDADFRAEVIVSCQLIGLAVLWVVAAFLWRRLRIIALLVLGVTVAFRGSSVKLLLVEAYPSSFQTSPTRFSAESIASGQTLFGPNCASCHGDRGAGDGPLAKQLRIRPADLTMPHLWDHSDGELFWWLTNGIDDPEGGLAMPGFPALSGADRWALIDYIRAHNAAMAMQLDTSPETPLPAPTLPIHCAATDAARMEDLRGSVVHVVADGAKADLSPIPPQLGVPVVTLALRSGHPPAGGCVAATAAAWPAYAVLADVPADQLSGAEFLIDANGWLRAGRPPHSPGGWHTRDDLISAVRGICVNPIQQASEGEHEHHH